SASSSLMISFVGAGPGAPDLITLRGADRLSRADVVIWASSLVPEALLQHAADDAVIHDSAAMTLEDVIAVYDTHPDDRIVRLHSGDPSVYGAIQEQIDWCTAHGRSFEIVPGVSSLAAVAAHRPTMAVFPSAARPQEVQYELLAGYPAETPAAIVIRATWPDERVVRTTVGALQRDLTATKARTTVLVLVGDALASEQPVQRSHLYSPSYSHKFRKASRSA